MKSEQYTAKVAVVVPVYRPLATLPENELKSLLQIKRVLGSRDIFLFHPPSTVINDYLEVLAPLKVKAICIDARYFGNVRSGNSLLMTPLLYKMVSEYQYMLLCHTDAYVFSDQLDYWCDQNLDYIGAPWFKGKKTPVYPLQFEGVGNGGLSLRKVSSFLKISNSRVFTGFYFLLCKIRSRAERSKSVFFQKYFGDALLKRLNHYVENEDEFWGLIVPRFYKWFKVAKPEVALKFSFEVLPRALLKLNNNELPFGCHAWERYDPEFWKPFIHQDSQNVRKVNS